jgi:hypothetical protein
LWELWESVLELGLELVLELATVLESGLGLVLELATVDYPLFFQEDFVAADLALVWEVVPMVDLDLGLVEAAPMAVPDLALAGAVPMVEKVTDA